MLQSPPLFPHVAANNRFRPNHYFPGYVPTATIPKVQTPNQPNNGEVNSSAHLNINHVPAVKPMDVRLKILEEQNEKMLAILAKLPGAAVAVEVEPKTGYQASPYVDEIALVDIPKKYSIPAFTTKYSGITNPVEHDAQYKQLMWTASILIHYQEVCMCKSFGSTLTVAALQWLINLKLKTIGSFVELVNQFTQQFASSHDAIFQRKHSNEKKVLSAQKHDFKPKRVNKVETSRQVSNVSNVRFNKGSGKTRYPELYTYNFAGTLKELVDSLRNIEANVRWPKKSDNPRKDKDHTKWCEFHGDHGHTTDEWTTLRKEVASSYQRAILRASSQMTPRGLHRQFIPKSSANVIFADTTIMGIERSNIVRRTTTLVGFNGDTTNTLGEITLPVFAKGINKQTKFNVTNCQSAYNAILGRPWIHDMKAEHSDCFAWSHEDMVGIDPNVISHKLNIDQMFKPIKQKHRKFAPERNKVINDKVDNLLKMGKMREVKYPDWLANVVVVQNNNRKWQVCIDFTDLNKACPKDPFSLPHIDAMVDVTAGHELLTFMDAYSGYNHILMHLDDQEKTAFMTDKGIYCYKVMPFGLKNGGSTYQRLVNMMKSFDILRRYKMKLNPTKCSFGVRARKFLGYMVTRRGIEVSSEQIKAIMELQSLRNVKEDQDQETNELVLQSTDPNHRSEDLLKTSKSYSKNHQQNHLIGTNRFISRSSDKCHLFYNVLRKNQGSVWIEAHEKALQDLKQYMSSPPLLTKPIIGESLQLYLDVSNNAMSAVLVREQDRQQSPIYNVLADFIAEFSPELDTMTQAEVNNVMIQDNKPWILQVDGSSNIRGSGLGVVLKSPQGGNMVYSMLMPKLH
ncbi:hypothetical protein OSB04_002393 [Centaurea solstitialis]|uniref:Uncharacterized protein n=1 Tax=Centaurea solstitialis TaxID=347529 RepID=A0AA38UAN4_9ASTR|nr:hypothetical protein OSB04_002393 [Centaurea solstitialis]